MRFENILVPLDGTPTGRAALPYAFRPQPPRPAEGPAVGCVADRAPAIA